MRDIGGIIAKSGKVINELKFIRSNLPSGLSAADLSFLINNKINTVIDLRTIDDVQNRISDLNSANFNYHNIQMKGAGFPESEARIPEGYLEMIEDGPTIKHIFEMMANSPAGIIFNCNAGKDRTGVIAMLLLLLADAFDTDILADYQVSYTFIKDDVIKMLRQNPDLPSWLGQSKSEYMEETLKLFRHRYHDINNYLNHIGVHTNTKNSILDKLFN